MDRTGASRAKIVQKRPFRLVKGFAAGAQKGNVPVKLVFVACGGLIPCGAVPYLPW
jgi:hypothetical protein